MDSKWKHVRFCEPEEYLAECSHIFGINKLHYSQENPKEKHIDNDQEKESIINIVKENDAEIFIYLLCTNVKLYQYDFYDGLSVVHLASKFGALNIMEHILLSYIFSVDTQSTDHDKTTPLFWAVHEGNCEMTSLLLHFGASDFPVNTYQDSAVFAAVYYEKVDVLKVLIDYGCNCNGLGKQNESPLCLAIQKNSSECVQLLIEGGTKITEFHFQQALFIAADYSKRAEVAHVLITYMEQRLENSDFNGVLLAALNRSLRWSNDVLAEDLIKRIQDKADLIVSFRNSIRRNNLYIVKKLLTKGVSVTYADLEDAASLYYAEMLTLLIAHVHDGLDTYSKKHLLQEVVARSIHRMCPYSLFSSDRRHLLSVEREWREEVISENHRRFLAIMQILLNNEVVVDTVLDKSLTSTAIHVSLQNGLVCISLFLLMAGANPSRPNMQGQSPFYTIFKLLLQVPLMYPWKKQNLCRLLAGLDLIAEITPNEREEMRTMCSEENNVSVYGSLPDYVQNIIQKQDVIPKSLMHLCRMSIITYLSPNSHCKVVRLTLPRVIQNYLHFRDLDEFLMVLAGRKRTSSSYRLETNECVHIDELPSDGQELQQNGVASSTTCSSKVAPSKLGNKKKRKICLCVI